jgi:hypothetical protein
LTWKERKKERKEEKKNNSKNSRHYAPLQGLRAAHALRSDEFNVFPGVYNFRKYFKSRYGNDLVKNYYGDSSPLVLLKLFNLPYSHLHIVDVLHNVQLGPQKNEEDGG